MNLPSLLSWCQRFVVGTAAVLFPALALPSFSAEPGAAAPSMAPLQPGAEDIRGILVVPRVEDVNPSGISGIKGVVVKGPDFLLHPEYEAVYFEMLLKQYLNRPLTDASLAHMQTNIIQYCRSRGHLVVDVFYREQDILEGTIQVAIIEGKIGKITVDNPGHKWFSDSLILRGISLKPGDAVTDDQLNRDLNWANRNTYQSLGYFDGTFRDVNANFVQGNLGQTDLQLKVQDRFPLRAFVGYEDSGIDTIGKDRMIFGANWANAFWQDHRLNYEYITDTQFDKLREHLASYTIPLPWRHELTFFGAYADINPDLSVISPSLATLKNDGTYYQVSGRYNVPLPPIQKIEHEISAGFDFKRTDTPLLFQAGTAGDLLRTNNIDVAQFAASYAGRVRDPWGRTGFSLQGYFSPGDWTSHNKQADYTDFSPGTDPRYVYGRLEIRRETLLPWKFSLYTRGVGQYADSKLVATEQFSIGGYDTVRGYDERIVSGDHGWLLVNELRTPPLVLGNLTRRANQSDWIQGLVFCDYGTVINRSVQPGQVYNQTLASVGLGFRLAMADNLHVRFDYGFQLNREYLNAPNAASLGPQTDRRAHFGVELSF